MAVFQVSMLFLLLLLSGFFSGSEVALISLSRSKVRALVAKGVPGAFFVKRLKDNPQRMLSTILIGNNVVNVAASAIMTSLAIGYFQNYAVGIATGVMTFLILIFGEITPKSIASQHSEVVSLLVAPVIWSLSWVLAPLLNLLDSFLNRFISLFGIKSRKGSITEEEIIGMIAEASEQGSIKESEKNLLSRIFKFDDMNVADIATPRADMVLLSSKSTLGDALKLMLKSNFSRVPVYEKSRDSIVGVVYIKDVIAKIQRSGSRAPVSKVMSKPFFVPDSKKVSSLLKQFQKRKEHLAVVVNEHGAITGVVTTEDVLEEIVGEIMDETEKIDPDVLKLSRTSWRIKGKAEIEEVIVKTGMPLKEEDYDTFSGFILKQLGRIPSEGDSFDFSGFRIKVEEVEKQRISKVLVERV